ncbi:hypothetical protein SCLCIDRAFT_1213076 [Scleroderma citrinum Foug A]|uniref:Uncharacterized protein n=1 Tax=Scleroderma citrinum Foug A TaxID=1036808 RepID=A0A0C2ZSR6_9AGAM|nr:hypothetical protein SCLCIDRAFT_1213076 [Scleroderma citrinum Foug A]
MAHPVGLYGLPVQNRLCGKTAGNARRFGRNPSNTSYVQATACQIMLLNKLPVSSGSSIERSSYSAEATHRQSQHWPL